MKDLLVQHLNLKGLQGRVKALVLRDLLVKDRFHSLKNHLGQYLVGIDPLNQIKVKRLNVKDQVWI